MTQRTEQGVVEDRTAASVALNHPRSQRRLGRQGLLPFVPSAEGRVPVGLVPVGDEAAASFRLVKHWGGFFETSSLESGAIRRRAIFLFFGIVKMKCKEPNGVGCLQSANNFRPRAHSVVSAELIALVFWPAHLVEKNHVFGSLEKIERKNPNVPQNSHAAAVKEGTLTVFLPRRDPAEKGRIRAATPLRRGRSAGSSGCCTTSC
jgi:hypothetical protein